MKAGKQKKEKVTKEKEAEAAVPTPTDANGNKLSAHLRKTKFCLYHLQGVCQFGSQCSFAHSLNEMHQTPDLRKTQICQAYEEGKCNDPNCTFAHGDDELRTTGMFFKVSKCIWYEKGKCRNGDKCRFAHGTKEIRGRAEGEVQRALAGQTGQTKRGGQKTKQDKGRDDEPSPPPPYVENPPSSVTAPWVSQGRWQGQSSNNALGYLGQENNFPAGSNADFNFNLDLNSAYPQPMKIHPNQFEGVGLRPPAPPAWLGGMPQFPPDMPLAPPPMHPDLAHPLVGGGGNVNSDMAALSKSIATLTEQCADIQKRMLARSISESASQMGMPGMPGVPPYLPAGGGRPPYPLPGTSMRFDNSDHLRVEQLARLTPDMAARLLMAGGLGP